MYPPIPQFLGYYLDTGPQRSSDTYTGLSEPHLSHDTSAVEAVSSSMSCSEQQASEKNVVITILYEPAVNL